MTTKEKILKEALELFAKNGYQAVSVAKIAEAVGIKAPSLYKHYKSKRDIFEAIIIEKEKRYRLQAEMMNINGTDANEDKDVYTNITEEKLLDVGKQLFLYFIHDEFESKFRQMLMIEQFHNAELASYFVKQHFDDALAYQKLIFTFLKESKRLEGNDPKIMALHFYAPIYLLMNVCDSQPQREKEALQLLEHHIRQFNEMYQKRGQE